MPTIEKVKGQIDQLQSQRRGKSNELEDRTQHLHRSLESCFDRQQSEFPGLFGRQYGKFAQTAVECIQFFTGCLLLYVPDRPFDPALKPKVERDRHHKHRFRLEKKLRALQDFELVFSGQKSSFRSQLVEKLLKDLGAEPHATAIARPSVSELGQLQAEFNNVLYAIVLRSPTEEMLQSVFRNDTAKVQEIELLRTNISQAVLRLSEAYRAYEDVTQALVGFLHGLDTGLALSLLVASQLQPNQNATQYMCEMTPFCGAGPHALPKTTFADLERQNREVVDLRLHFLKCFGIAHSVTQDVGETSVDTMFHSFHSLYDGWKQQLGQDQRQNAVKSSLYRYRGSEADGDDAAGEDFHNLFPDYEHRSEQFIDSTAHRPSPRDQAQQVSCLHRDIFQSPENTSLRILDLLGVTATRIAESHRDGAHLYQCPVPAATMLSALTLSLDQHKRLLCGQAEPGRQYNFYTDTNLSEVRKLLALIDDIQARFSDLQVAWPEHATLEDVLRTSSELLGLRHTEPIAKILTKAEQLHGYLHEWQLVASREYSAVTLYDQLTGLLVGWRRLELSTWARLLDMEDQRCRDHSDSWWFIAYEVIIAAPLSNINTSGDIQIHAQQLFNTLADFLHNTSMGQYSHRLGMVDCFRGHLNMLIQTIPSMGVLHNTVVNFLSYYKRFEKPIHDFLHKGRQTLEKDMKEILLFASWKDTNIIALRDSAKRCHHKLFKVIRKYRALLAQNAESVIMQEFPENPVLGIPSRLAARTTELLEVDRQAIQVCSKRIDSWDTKPERFKNPVSTVERMLAMSQPPSSAMDLASYLDTFGSGLVDNIRALQKATPSKATKENSEAIKHLKARKRKLYAETLRALRQMGLRSNMGADALARQESLSVVLTNTPALTAVSCESEASAAECYLHSLLRIMPEVKEQSRDHSEDLNHGEVARSIGYLESMLSVILKQRAVLAATSTDVDELEKTSSKLQNLWDPDKYTLKKQDHGKQAVAQATKHTLRHLPGMIEAGSVIIEKHGEMGGFDWSTILDILEEWHGKITKAIKNIDLLPQLPTQLSSSQHERIQAHSANVIHCFREQLQGLMEENPRIAFVLKQIHLWTDISVVNDDAHTNGESGASIADLDDRFSSTSDSILVAIQRFQEFSSSVPSSDEETTWLIRTDISLAISLNHLRPREINNQLAEAMSKVQHLVTSDDSQLQVAAALCAIVMPVVQQYRNIVQTALEKYAVFHRSLCKFANLLSRSFLQIVKEGFCKPAENSASETENSEKLEGGTGLGEGEGAEDISKDIQDDEDLSELAQEANKEKKKEGIEDQEDAVDMDHDELEGEMGDVSDNGEDEGSSSEPGDNEIDEEAGKIDALDPGAVDEKLWDGKAEGKEKEKGGTKQGGKVDKDEEAAADLNQQESREEVGEEEADLSQIGAEEGEQVAREETEQLDPHAQEGRNLDLPEEMDLDKADVSEVDSASVESDIEGMSDIDQDNMGEEQDDRIFDADQPSESKETIKDESSPQDHTEDSAKKEIDADRVEEAGSPMDTDPDDDELQNDDQGLLQNSTDNRDVDQEDVAPSDAVGVGDGSDRQDADERKQEGNAQGRRGTQGKSANSEEQQAEAEDGQFGPRMDNTEAGQPEKEPLNQNTGSQAFKKLGDALERWHRQNKKIQDTSEQEAKTETKRPDMKLADQDFEHLQDEAAEADTQALGAATDEQAHALDDQALNSELRGEPPDFPMDEMREEGAKDQDVAMEDEEVIQTELKQQEEQSRHGAFISNRTDGSIASRPGEAGREHDEDIHDFNNEISTTHLQPAFEAPPRSVEEARRLWSHYEMLTHRLTLSLTEQLRLILAPTIATKMRGDYRTGKRLNMKRIIPYIASQYKRDKIWMRRSVPSKRGYQIMLAVDDSKSMGESGSGQLAFETLALVSKSLSMLEVGEICIVGFGNEVDVAHEFDNPFSSEAGAQILQHFSFQQTTTNVRKLVADSITLFREARRKTTNSATDLWQLELIISDGVCEDHDGIRLLVRQAQEERIMIVFVIVDALLKAESIMDMSEAVFEPDAITGETKLKIKRYLDGFPFPYYVVVGDVRELPRVLAQALRQWFAEVVESG